MADENVDPSGNTAQFQAFVQRTEVAPDKAGTSRMLVIGIVAAVVVVVAVVAIVAL